MRIGINALYLIPGGVGGTEIYLRNLLCAFAGLASGDEFVVFANRETGGGLAPAAPGFRTVGCGVRASFRPARILYEQTVLPARVRAERIDVLLNPGFTAPVVAPCPMVTVFHDLQHKRHPEHFRWYDLPFWRLLLWASASRSRCLMSCSEATRADLLHFYGKESRLAPYGVDPAFFGLEWKPCLERPYLLTVSTLHPHKNLERLLGAFARLASVRPGLRLVVAGLRGFLSERLEAVRREWNLAETVEFTGWIPRQDLYRLYERASGFVYPSTFEGFGLPVLEAMAAGIPVACSEIEPLASNTAGAALLFDPGSDDAVFEALLRLTSDVPLRDRLCVEGPRRARQFDWNTTARLTLDGLREAAAGGRGGRGDGNGQRGTIA